MGTCLTSQPEGNWFSTGNLMEAGLMLPERGQNEECFDWNQDIRDLAAVPVCRNAVGLSRVISEPVPRRQSLSTFA